MGTDVLTLARIDVDPDIAERGDNAQFAGDAVELGAVALHSKTYGQTVTASGELIDDAPNAAAMIEHSLANSMALSIDSLILAEVLANAGSTTAVGGAITHAQCTHALEALELNNHTPTAIIVNPAIAYDIRILTTGDGTNSTQMWWPAHPDVKAIRHFVTNQWQLANAYTGDFSKAYLGVRLGIEVMSSGVAEEAYSRFQQIIRLVWRGACVLGNPSGFHTMTGLTS